MCGFTQQVCCDSEWQRKMILIGSGCDRVSQFAAQGTRDQPRPWLMVEMRRFMIVGALQYIGSRCHRLEMLTMFLFVWSQTIILAHIDGSKRVKRSESKFSKN